MANFRASTISAFVIDQTTGALTAVAGSPFRAGTFPISLSIDDRGNFLYAANEGSNNMSVYRINAMTGGLTLLAQQPSGTQPRSISTAVLPYIGAADAYVELSRLEPNYNLLSQLARQAHGTVLEIDHAPRRFPDVVRTERKELLAPPGSYLWGTLLITLLFLDVALRSRKLQGIIGWAKIKDEG